MYKKILFSHLIGAVFINILMVGNIDSMSLTSILPIGTNSQGAVSIQLVNTSALSNLYFIINCVGVPISGEAQSVNENVTQVTIQDLNQLISNINSSLNQGHIVKIVYATHPVGQIFTHHFGTLYSNSQQILSGIVTGDYVTDKNVYYNVSYYQLICVVYDEYNSSMIGYFLSSQEYVNWYNEDSILKGFSSPGFRITEQNPAYSITISYADGNGITHRFTQPINQPPSPQGNPSVPQVIEFKPGIIPIRNTGLGGNGGISYQNVGGKSANTSWMHR